MVRGGIRMEDADRFAELQDSRAPRGPNIGVVACEEGERGHGKTVASAGRSTTMLAEKNSAPEGDDSSAVADGADPVGECAVHRCPDG